MFAGQDLTGTRVYSIRTHGPHYRLSENFTLVEFASRDGADVVLVHDALPRLLEALRLRLGGVALIIRSGYRTEAHNARQEGSALYSYHTRGMAADVVTAGATPNEVANAAEGLVPGGIGRYDTFTHIDVAGDNRRWDNRTKAA